MNRRTFLQATGSIWAGFVLTGAVPAVARTLSSSEWRSFEVVTSVELLQPKGEGRIWLPAVLTRDTPYQRTLSNRFSADGEVVRQTGDKQNALGIVSADFPAGTKPRLTLASRVLLRNYSVDLSSRTTALPVSRAELSYFLQPSRYVPTDGIVRETAAKVTAGATSDVDKARAIYEWIVDNTFRDPKVRAAAAVIFDSRWSLAIWAANAPT
jgi:transglutaminase-like putative cysteine protease